MIKSILLLGVQAVSVIWLVYCIMTFVNPSSSFVYKIRPLAEPVLMPCRRLIYRVFPKAEMMPVDFSPIVVWFALDIIIWVIRML